MGTFRKPDSAQAKKATGEGWVIVLFSGVGDLEGSGRPYNMRDTHSLKWMANRRDLTVRDFWILIAVTDASFLAILGGAVLGRKWVRK